MPKEPLPILYVVQIGESEFQRFMIEDQQDRVWTGKQFDSEGGVLFARHNDAAIEAKNILKRAFDGVEPQRFVVPLYVEVLNHAGPVPVAEVAQYLSCGSRLYINCTNTATAPARRWSCRGSSGIESSRSRSFPMTNRPSAIVLMFRYFITVFVFTFLISIFWNGLSGTNMFPFNAVIGVSVVLTVIFNVVGWATTTIGINVLLNNDPDYQKWKRMGGRPYWDSLGWPINTATPIERETGLAEPDYEDFVPPADWRYQCPVCGSRVEKQIDVCWRCGYGRDGDSTAYHQRWGNG